jgi:acyl-CoA reductase-like NAD-dependent aldehyde dehydrogenase
MSAGPEHLHPVNPATGEPLAPVACTTPEELTAIVDRARTAARAWAETSLDERAARLRAFAAALQGEASERLAQQLSREMGKPIREARTEVRGVATRIEAFITQARLACAEETGEEGGIRVTVRWRPLGVVAVIGPWNYPVATPNNLVVSALLTGNAAVFKPSEFTPHTGALYGELLAEHLPAGLLGLVQGTGSVGAALVASAVDMVAFTGSIATGQAIMRSAATTMKRLVLELGGKDPMIVLPGADLEAAARHAAIEATRNAGQVCVAVERIIVHQDIAEAFAARVAEIVRGLQVGDPQDEATQIGPMANARQRELVLGQLARARAAGARFLVEGESRGPGFYLTPSVVVGVTPEMDLARDETFGPVVAIQVARDADEAVARANDTIYGLGASVWGPPGAATEAVADKLQVGMVGVNRGLSTAGGAPWVGWKMSGFGYTRSTAGMRQFMQPQSRASRA